LPFGRYEIACINRGRREFGHVESVGEALIAELSNWITGTGVGL
jgi:hypothetical protein